MTLSRPELERAAASTGFQVEPLEKALRLLDLHELAAGKPAALFSRNASRDLFDVCTLLRSSNLDWSRVRLGFVIYGGANRKDWRKISLDDVQAEPREVEQQLLPMLRADLVPARSDIVAWSKRLVDEGCRLLAGLFPLTAAEMEFLELLNGVGEVRPDLLTDDEAMQSIIQAHPGLQWKALNVRKITLGFHIKSSILVIINSVPNA